jgi:sortase (surface protein transpeptidase)
MRIVKGQIKKKVQIIKKPRNPVRDLEQAINSIKEEVIEKDINKGQELSVVEEKVINVDIKIDDFKKEVYEYSESVNSKFDEIDETINSIEIPSIEEIKEEIYVPTIEEIVSQITFPKQIIENILIL